MSRDSKVALWLALGVYLFSGLSPVGTSFDSRWTVHIAMSMLKHGTTNLDDYARQIREADHYATHCIAANGSEILPFPAVCPGHWYQTYPMGAPVMTAPLIWVAVGVMHTLHPLIGNLHIDHPVIEGFFRADYDAAHPLIEMEVASMLLAASAVVIYFIARRFLPEKRALMLALLYALATSAYSVGGRAIWQHTPSMLMLAIIILLLLKAEENPKYAAWAGLPVAISYTCRPTDAILVVVFTIYVAVRFRAQLLKYLLFAAPVAAIFVTYNYSIYHNILTPYYRSDLSGVYPRNWGKLSVGLEGNLISPSRGLLVYTPVFLFSIWSMIRGLWKTPLAPWLAVITLLHWIAVSAYIACWWAGMCYGPRFFSDMTPIFVLFLIPYFARWSELSGAVRTVFVALALIGLAIHLRGGWSIAVHKWNVLPQSVDRHPERNWDWSDPPFLRWRTQ